MCVEYTSVGQKHLKETSVDNDFIPLIFTKCTVACGTPVGSSKEDNEKKLLYIKV